ncbi:MAG TPA: lysylphosphatidylglycerol synthase domain-containing protein [Casimicrobiaceae bacterium]|nr:lysylphosphatidylglycerol synthase domain-containing protein [Casimicrobiaceae bacterium]
MNAESRGSPTRQRLRVAVGVAFSVAVVGAFFLTARRLTTTAWPLQEANVVLVLGAAAAYLASFFLRALGWQVLFPGDRPDRSRCLAACGAAAASGAVLPFRLDYVVKIWTLRRLGGVRLGLDTVALSIVSLGIVDAVAMLPLAVCALATSDTIFLAPLIVVLLFCVGCITILALGPRLVRLPFVDRSDRVQRSFRRVGDHAAVSRSTFVAGGFLFGCWSTRTLGCTLLLSALGAGFSPSFALVVICLAAATSILPITAGGAIVNIGTTSAVLLALGVAPRAAINFSLASGMLLTLSALVAAAVGAAASIVLTIQRRHLAHAAPV